MSTQLNDLRLQVERLDYDNKESAITVDILKEQNQDAGRELEELRQAISELKANQKDSSLEDKEKKKQEKMALMKERGLGRVQIFRLRIGLHGAAAKGDDAAPRILDREHDAVAKPVIGDGDVVAMAHQSASLHLLLGYAFVG